MSKIIRGDKMKVERFINGKKVTKEEVKKKKVKLP